MLRSLMLSFTIIFISLICAPFSSVDADPVLYVHDSTGMLGTVDVSTGTASTIGYMGTIMTDIAFDPFGNLFGISFYRLYHIDVATGAASLIGRHGIDSGNALVFSGDGTLYATGAGSDHLFTIDPATGAGSSVGAIGYESAGDLAFHGNNFYMSSLSDELIRIDLTADAHGVSVGSFGFTGVYGLATGDDGILYGIAGTEIFSVNTATGAGTLVNDFSGQGLNAAYGSSFVNETAQPVTPEPLSSTLFIVGGAVLGFRKFKKRFRQIPHSS